MSPTGCGGAATLPKGFRCEFDNDHGPRTPEPSAPGDEVPSPPRQRLRLRRRNVSSHLNAPTEQFLASVAAADVPMRSVEEADIAEGHMLESLTELQMHGYDDAAIFEHIHMRGASPPKTPAPELSPSTPSANYPSWSMNSWSGSDMESSPEYESSRPSTARSTATNSSLFSQFSHASEDDESESPEVSNSDFKSNFHADDAQFHQGKRKAPWTPAMSTHLWSTYMLYLQDPRVTPIRLGKSCIPPSGVCARVARESKRSWKGARTSAKGKTSGSTTPIDEGCRPFIQWPHTHAATRAHLRELCKLKAQAQKAGRASRYASKSPVPFNMAAHRRWNRRSTPVQSAFSGQEMNKSLIISTSETMQPQGPLALLSAQPDSQITPPMAGSREDVPALYPPEPEPARKRLGSPFSHSYGPSSWSTFDDSFTPRQQSQTVGAGKLLGSPAGVARYRPGTQKRGSLQRLEHHGSRKRPSLADAIFGSPPEDLGAHDAPPVNDVEFSSTGQCKNNSFIPRSAAANDPFISTPAEVPRIKRLGSPFSGFKTSQTFPHRLSQPVHTNLPALRRPFATVQEPTELNSRSDSPRSNLATRLAYIDERLKEFRDRASGRRRSQSPPV